MAKTKKCPNCLETYDENIKKCEKCGYEFHVKEENEEVVVSNTIVIDDPVPAFVWKLISFVFPPLGFVFCFLWQNKWSRRAKDCGKMALAMSIAWFCIGVVWLIIAFGVKNGDVLI